MSRTTLTMTEALQTYLQHDMLREPEVLRRLREETNQLPDADLQTAPEQGQFMALVTRLMGARRVVEIGTFTGYSALWVALALPAEGEMICCDVNPEWTAIAQRYWREAGLGDRVTLRLGPGVESLDALLAEGEAGRFDLAFIDADKLNYDNYYERCLALLRPGGLIMIDNALWKGEVADPDADDPHMLHIRALNRKIHADARVEMCMLPVADGLMLALKK